MKLVIENKAGTIRASSFLQTLKDERTRLESQSTDMGGRLRQALENAEASLAANVDERMRLWDVVAEVQFKGNDRSRSSHVDRLMKEREQAIAATDEKRVHNNQEIKKRQDRMSKLDERLDRTLQDHRNAELHFESMLKHDSAYVGLVQAESQAKSELSELQSRHEHALEERDRKLPAYDNDPRFLHLMQRGYGTEGYAPPALTARLDDFVARVVGYREAKRAYDLLKEMPPWVAQYIEGAKERVEAAERERTAYENGAREKHDVASLDLIVGDIEKQKSRLDREISRLRDMGEALDSDRSAFSSRDDRHSHEIRRVYMTMFEAMSHSEMLDRARETASREDEKALRDIHRLEDEYKTLKRAVDDADSAFRAHQRQRQHLDQAISGLQECDKVTGRYQLKHSSRHLNQIAQLSSGEITVPFFVDQVLDDLVGEPMVAIDQAPASGHDRFRPIP